MKRAAGIIFRTMVLVLLGIAIGLFISNHSLMNQSLGFSMQDGDKISKVLNLVKDSYVDSVNVDSIEGATVNNLLQNLDPHSLYLPEQRATSLNEGLAGGFTGIGLEYQLLRDTLVITQIYTGGPAANAGLITGDRILEVNNKKFSGTHLTTKSVNKALRGDDKSAILVTVVPPNSLIKKQYTLKRGHVNTSSLDAAYMAAPGVGYIKISKFALTTDADFRDAIGKLKAKGLQKLVLDLRQNGGGYLNAATALADEFLTKGKLIVYTQGIHEDRRDYFATDSGTFQQGKLAVIIDEYSASASEILAGALQDLDRATIVGRRSFGKGLVQQQFSFDDGSAVNLTIARYYTPSGRSIQKSYKGGVDSYHNEIAERMRKGELFSAQSNLDDSIFKRPSTYHTANGRKVFSGGGIMPDVFVPADTTGNTYLVQTLGDQQLFSAYVIDKLQPKLSQFASAEDFIKQYNMSDSELNNFILYVSKTIKEIDSRELAQSKSTIKTLVKANAARFKWGDNAYFEAINSDDITLVKAVEAVK
ncbi:S41 family peptidase [Mucilaginibacter flavidus]|uniref:S41 family peptidase n=1 Tax=Mucilaginibacter flavidus TaxID=2949309 RepID=UPI0020927C04|nr:S41 family peptidase [Mucilaginibacter flavidus]MCO5947170.1 S41 family peptidase [Mucilaginibacter flavidus]